MECNCIKEFSFNIKFNSCSELVYTDTSIWADAPETYSIVIVLPGSSKEYNFTIEIGKIKIIKAEDFGLTILPIGVYCVIVVNCNGDKIRQDFLNLCSLECSLSNLIATTNLDECENLSKYMKYKTQLEGIYAKFNCDWCNKDEVTNLIKQLKKELDGEGCSC
jgi:hypothetical protein